MLEIVNTAAEPETILSVRGLQVNFGGVTALNGVDLDAKKGQITALIGPNGSGKSTLLNCINGFHSPNRGKILFCGRDITGLSPHKVARLGIARTFQHVELFLKMSVVDNLMAARHLQMKTGVLDGMLYFGSALREETEHRRFVEQLIDFLELQPVRTKAVGTLSYGWRKRTDLGRALALEPKVILLDEPMAGMNVDEKEDMARFVLDVREEFGTTFVLVEHDMSLVMDVSDRIHVLDSGEKIAEGTAKEISDDPRVIEVYLGRSRVTRR